MKIKGLLISMLACTALVGCTSDDVVENNNLNKNNSNAYMAVKLVMTESAGSRAASDGGFLVGTEAEKEIKGDKSIFLFYDANGKYVTSGQVISATAFTDGCEDADEDHGEIEASANNDQKTTAYIVLSGTDEQIKNIDKVLTVVNYSQCESLKYKTLVQAQAAIATDDLSSETDPTDDDDANAGNAGFLMSTSVYYNANSELINYTAIDDDDFHTTQESALADGNPVVIHIERAAAKVELGFNASYDLEEKGEGKDDAGDMTIDGELKQVTVNIKGWKLNNINSTTNLIKDISEWDVTSDYPNTAWANWNVADNHRSYWAKSTNWNMTAGNVKAETDVNGAVLKVYSYNDATIATTTPEYCWEQTVETQDGDKGTPNPNVTTVLIAAEFTFDGDEDGTDYFKYNGIYYSESSYKALILQQLKDAGYKKVTGDTESDLEATDLEIVSNGTLAGVKFDVKAGDNTTFKKGEDTPTATEIATAINVLDYVTKVKGYKDGACYYQIPIEHLTSTDENPFYGVVRNHWYKLTVDGVKHIGEAVFDPEKEIPEIPAQTTEYYMAAELHVLSWHVVNQGVTLE